MDLIQKLAFLVGLVIGITVHEASHAWSASRLGDPTARYQGRVTLNPLAHLDPLGSLMMLYSLLGGFGIGWGKPTPVNPLYLRYGPRTGLALVAIAGPISNILTAMVFAVPLRLAPSMGIELPLGLMIFFYSIVMANLGLAVFNVIPIPPLDGFSVLLGLLSQIRQRWSHELSAQLHRLESYGPMVLLVVLMVDYAMPGRGILGTLIIPPLQLLSRLILGF